jgi:hypothetical protein
MTLSTSGGSATTLGGGYFGPGITVGGGNVYVTNTFPDGVDVAPVATASRGTPPALISNIPNVWAVAVDAANVYFTCYGEGVGGIFQAPITGGTPITLDTSAGYAIAVDATSVYWVADGDGTVMKAPIGGGATTTLASGQSGPRGIAVDGTSVYWANDSLFGGGSVLKVPLAGGSPTVLVSGEVAPNAPIAVDATSVYWASDSAIMKVTPK